MDTAGPSAHRRDLMRYVLLVLLLAACANVTLKQYQAASQLAPDDAFDCVQAKLPTIGLTLEDANREAGFLRAKSVKEGMRLNGQPYNAEVTVSIVRDQAGHSTLNVTSTEKKYADALLAACEGKP